MKRLLSLLLAVLLPLSLLADPRSTFIYQPILTPMPQQTPGQGTSGRADVFGAAYQTLELNTASYAYGTLAFGGVTTAYATLITNSNAGRILDCFNNLDHDVLFSIDGSTDALFLPKSTGKVLTLASVNLKITSNLSVKSIGGNAGAGNIYCTILY